MRSWDCEAGLGGDLAEDRNKRNSRKVGLKAMPVSELGVGWGVLPMDEWNTPRMRRRLRVDLSPDWRIGLHTLSPQPSSLRANGGCM